MVYVSVRMHGKDEKFVMEVADNCRIEEIIKRIGYEVSSIIPLKNGKIAHEKDILKEGDSLKIIGVISGG